MKQEWDKAEDMSAVCCVNLSVWILQFTAYSAVLSGDKRVHPA